MKVVLFCGGLGTRLREYSETIPKPLVDIGGRPIVWHLMKYYAHFGHKEFILCLGHGGNQIREYFANFRDWASNDFSMIDGKVTLHDHGSDVFDWKISFIETGLMSNIGQRLLRIKSYLEREELFLANYSDGLSDIPLPEQIRQFEASGCVCSVGCVRPSQMLSGISTDEDGLVTRIDYLNEFGLYINGGFFVMRPEIFNHVRAGEELVEEPFQRLVADGKLAGYRHDGFWGAVDTLKDKKRFDAMYAADDTPWMIWRTKS